MIYPIIILIISFILDGIMSRYINLSFSSISMFTTIYSLICLISICCLYSDDKKYYLSALVLGLFFDMVYTGSFILNAVSFSIISIITRKLYNILTYNIINNTIISCLGIIFHYVFTNIILTMVGYLNFNVKLLLDILYHSLIMSIIYSLILYLINSIVIKHKSNNIKAIR